MIEFEGEIWPVPTEIKYCLDSNLKFILKQNGHKRIFSSKEIKDNLNIWPAKNWPGGTYIDWNSNILSFWDDPNLDQSKYAFYKWTGSVNNISDFSSALTNINDCSYMYWNNNRYTSNTFIQSFKKDSSNNSTKLTSGTYNITGIGRDSRKYLYTLIISDSSNGDYISMPNSLKIQISWKTQGKNFVPNTQYTKLINSLMNPTNTIGPIVNTIFSFYNIYITVNGKKRLISATNMKTLKITGGFTIPHWEYTTPKTATYYGALSKIPNNTAVTINLADNVILPFGFSQSQSNQMQIQQFAPGSTKTPPEWFLYFNDKTKIITSQVNNPLTLTTIKTSTTLSNFSITGGIISGELLYRVNALYNGGGGDNKRPRADYNGTGPLDSNIVAQSIQYWIFAGLLEVYASGNITLQNISIIGGRSRGIAATQLNGFNIHNTSMNRLFYGKSIDELGDSLTDDNTGTGTAFIKDSQFILNLEGQADGLDSKCLTTTITNCYIQAIDDCLKIESNITYSKEITILSGWAGGAINIGGYGYCNSGTGADISNVYIHELIKTNNTSNICSAKWPGPSVIFAPYYPLINPSNKINTVTINNLYYPVLKNDLNWWSGDQFRPYFRGGYVTAGFDPSGTLNITPMTGGWAITDSGFNYTPEHVKLYSNISGVTTQISLKIKNKSCSFKRC